MAGQEGRLAGDHARGGQASELYLLELQVPWFAA